MKPFTLSNGRSGRSRVRSAAARRVWPERPDQGMFAALPIIVAAIRLERLTT